MLRSLKELHRYAVSTSDGATGSVVDFLLDDEGWQVRYVVIETGASPNERRVPVPPSSFRRTDDTNLRLHLAATSDELHRSPSVDAETPAANGVHLRTIEDVCGSQVHGVDNTIGRLEDLIIDDDTWRVRYVVVDTINLMMGKQVLIATAWITGANWSEGDVHVGLSRESIKKSPGWNPNTTVSREYELRLFEYYGRPGYWGGGGGAFGSASTRPAE